MLIELQLFQAKYALPGAQEGIHKISIPTLSKGITWQRMRAATKSDPYFSQFYDEFLYAFAEEVPVKEDSSCSPISLVFLHIEAF